MKNQIVIFAAMIATCFGWHCETVYKILPKGRVVLGSNMSLQTEEIHNMKRPIIWKNGKRSLECDRTCYKDSKYEVLQSGNTSTLYINNVSKEDLIWEFRDDNDCYAKVCLKEEGWKCERKHETHPREVFVLGGRMTVHVEYPSCMERPVVWYNGVSKVECNASYCDHGKYAVRQNDRFSTLFIGNITEDDSRWSFYDNSSCAAIVPLKEQDTESPGTLSTLQIVGIVFGIILSLVLISIIIYFNVPQKWKEKGIEVLPQ